MKAQTLITGGFVLVLLSLPLGCFEPWTMFPPHRDAGGYYQFHRVTKEKVYSEYSKDLYLHIWSVRLASGGLFVIGSVGVASGLIKKYRKRPAESAVLPSP